MSVNMIFDLITIIFFFRDTIFSTHPKKPSEKYSNATNFKSLAGIDLNLNLLTHAILAGLLIWYAWIPCLYVCLRKTKSINAKTSNRIVVEEKKRKRGRGASKFNSKLIGKRNDNLTIGLFKEIEEKKNAQPIVTSMRSIGVQSAPNLTEDQKNVTKRGSSRIAHNYLLRPDMLHRLLEGDNAAVGYWGTW